MTIIIFIVILAVLIFVHELGHFLAARAFGIRVDAFKLGFGPKLFHWKRGETEYGVNLIPFGGYVKIFGEDPDAASTEGPEAARKSFVHKARWKQVIVLAAGVLCNFIFAWVLYIVVFSSGFTASPDGLEQYSGLFKNERIMITSVAAGSPAQQAGLKAGDTLLSAGQASTSPASPSAAPARQSAEDIQSIVNASAGKPVAVSYERDGQTSLVSVTPDEHARRGKIRHRHLHGGCYRSAAAVLLGGKGRLRLYGDPDQGHGRGPLRPGRRYLPWAP